MDDDHDPGPGHHLSAHRGRRWWIAALVLAASCSAGVGARPSPPPPGPPPIADTQPATDAPLFVGTNTFANPLARQATAVPVLGTTRVDGAHSGVVDGPAPLGQSPGTGSDQAAVGPPLLWDHRGDLTAGCQAELAEGVSKACLAAVDPATFAVTARWSPPGQDLNGAHAVIDDQQRVVVTTQQNHVLVLQRPVDQRSLFRLVREVDVTASLGAGEVLRAATEDRRGNIWFTTGGRRQGPAATTSTVGYINSGDQVAVTRIADQTIEHDLAVGADNVFVVTAPAAATAATAGFVLDLTASSSGPVPTVQLVWREQYDAGTGRKPGAVDRGSGSGIVLLGNRFVTITDNADAQARLLVYAQGALPAGGPRGRLLCQVPLFSPGASAVNAAPIGYDSDGGDSVIVANGYQAPAVPARPAVSAAAGVATDLNGPANSMGAMAAGLSRIDVLPDGSDCPVTWSLPIRMKSGPLLDTATGLIYGYSQDAQRAAQGSYVWYFVAADYRTGRLVWQQRTGAGGSKNDNFLPISISPDGTLYQVLADGVAWMRDVTPHR